MVVIMKRRGRSVSGGRLVVVIITAVIELWHLRIIALYQKEMAPGLANFFEVKY